MPRDCGLLSVSLWQTTLNMPRSNFMESSPLLLLFVLGYCLAVIEGELRCYCNESGCVSTGYMCKSSVGQCFTSVEVRGEVTHQTHGCLDSLPKKHHESCRVGVEVISTAKAHLATGHLPLILCCKEHMCNYREDIDLNIILTLKHNGTFQRGSSPTSEDYTVYSRNNPVARDDERELWFKAAVIAVPISGGFILVLLVLLAVRMLRTDTRHHRRLIHIRHERSLTKAHMYISEHFNKSNKQQFSLFNEKAGHACVKQDKTVVSSKNGSGHTSNNTCQSSCFSDNSSKCCVHAPHNEIFHKCNSSSSYTGNHHDTTLPSNSKNKNIPNITRSTKSDSHNNGSVVNPSVMNPHTFYMDSPSKNVCLVKDHKLTDMYRTIPRIPKSDSQAPHSVPGYQQIVWDNTCKKGHIGVV